MISRVTRGHDVALLWVPTNPIESPKEGNERSEILAPFLRAVGGFVFGTVGFVVLFGVALATLAFLIVWAMTP